MADETPQASPPTLPPAPAPPPKAEQTVPYADFHKLVVQRDEARAAATAAAEQLAQAQEQLKVMPTLQGKVEELTAARERAEGRYGAFRAIAATGITEPELVDAIETHWQSLPKSGRPTLDAMLTEWRGTEETGPKLDAVPLLLRPHLAAKWKPAEAQQQPPPGNPRGGHAGSQTRGAPGGAAGSAAEVYDLAARRLRGEISQEDYDRAIRQR